jgi:hypothetical protein
LSVSISIPSSKFLASLALSVCVLSFVFSRPLYAESKRTDARLEFETGYGTYRYEESRDNQVFLDEEADLAGIDTKATIGFMFLPNWMDFHAYGRYYNPISKKGGNTTRVIEMAAQLALRVPYSRPMDLSLVVEQYQMKMHTNNSTFGLNDLYSTSWYPRLEFSLGEGGGLEFLMHIQYTAYTFQGERKELEAGLQFRVPKNTVVAFPYNLFQSDFAFKVEYSHTNIDIDLVRDVHIRIRRLSTKLSWNF